MNAFTGIGKIFWEPQSWPTAVCSTDMEAIYVGTTNADINNQHTDVMIEVQESEIQKHTFSTTKLQTFWCHAKWKGIPVSLHLPWRLSRRS